MMLKTSSLLNRNRDLLFVLSHYIFVFATLLVLFVNSWNYVR